MEIRLTWVNEVRDVNQEGSLGGGEINPYMTRFLTVRS